MDKQEATRNRIYFLQDLKNLLVKHNALLEIDKADTNGHVWYDLHIDDLEQHQVDNELMRYGEFTARDVDVLILNELKILENIK